MFVCPLFSQHGCSPGFVVDNGNENVELTRMTSTIFKILNDLLFFSKKRVHAGTRCLDFSARVHGDSSSSLELGTVPDLLREPAGK